MKFLPYLKTLIEKPHTQLLELHLVEKIFCNFLCQNLISQPFLRYVWITYDVKISPAPLWRLFFDQTTNKIAEKREKIVEKLWISSTRRAQIPAKNIKLISWQQWWRKRKLENEKKKLTQNIQTETVRKAFYIPVLKENLLQDRETERKWVEKSQESLGWKRVRDRRKDSRNSFFKRLALHFLLQIIFMAGVQH